MFFVTEVCFSIAGAKVELFFESPKHSKVFFEKMFKIVLTDLCGAVFSRSERICTLSFTSFIYLIIYREGQMWRMANFRHKSAYCIRFMHEVVPKVVATAVRIVMTRCRIFWMISFFIVMSFE